VENPEFDQGELFPEVPPDIVERIWQAADWHYKQPGVPKRLTRETLSRRLYEDKSNGPYSPSTIDRVRKKYPNLVPWPIERGQKRPWLTQPSQPSGETVDPPPDIVARSFSFHDDDRNQPVEVIADENGILRLASRWKHVSAAAAAAVSGFNLLDLLSDGQLNGVIRWCTLGVYHARHWL
jgi:hypothetical protein